MNLNSVLIGSEDAPRLAAFYSGLFGDPVWQDGGYTTWQIGTGSLTVGPHDAVKGRNAAPGRVIWNIEADDVSGEFERMRAAGATVVAEPYQMAGMEDFDGYIATLADPDDNYFQLITPMEFPDAAG